ncbi:uncharacterized protein LOC108232940 [Kryptolebias marmoratus]|uniref:uncharacterized protein LOC108232940 n=1 Tax=Kryptolebias marmoratus TaxID=37003 RepID=UPI0007F888BE|nr:uncharacterized protein LOC108232940 [Kryptolebias marmoratus]
MEVSDVSLTELTADQLKKILSSLDKLLFDEWISAPPSLSTLQHTQVYITELCALSLDISEELSLQKISNHLQSLIESISQSACNVSESFLLTQALYLTLMHFFTDSDSSDTDALVIAKQWAEEELSIKQLFSTTFLSILTSSLNTTVERNSTFILKMEIECVKLLLSTLTHLHSKETHFESTEMILKLVQRNQWTPMEAVNLLKALSLKCSKDDLITKVLTLVQVYDISPKWTDESGRSLTQILNFDHFESFYQDFQKILRKKDENSLAVTLSECKKSQRLDDSETDQIKNIITGVLKYSENPPKEATFMKDSLKSGTLNADDKQNCLSHLCKAVFDTKGWWPTVKHMLQWGVLVTGKTGIPQLVVGEEHPCAIAMFAATQFYMGNKVDIMLSSANEAEEQTKNWSDFYQTFGISVSTNMKKQTFKDVYEADVVYGTLENFVSDYFQYGKEVMEAGSSQLIRGFIIDMKSLKTFHNLNLSRLKDNESLAFSAEVLQNLMSKVHNEAMEIKHKFMKALFQVLQSNMRKDTSPESKIINILKKNTGKELLPDEIFILTFLENLLLVVTKESKPQENKTHPAAKWCLESLFVSLEHLKTSNEQTKEIFQTVSNLGVQTLWSPEEILNLLGALTDHHHDKGCVSIMKILHLMETYQVSSKWTDENNRSLIKLLELFTTENLIEHLQKSLGDDKEKSIDTLFDEICQMKNIDEQTLNKSYTVVTHVTDMIKTGEIKNHKDVQRAKTLSHSMETEDLQEILAVLCNAVHMHKAEEKWWPRTTQLISWCLLALSDTGKLLEMGTGEGKSCVIAMFAVLRVLRGEKVDVVSSSSVLCQRDAKEWENFYKYFGITVDTNTNKTDDNSRKECYQKDIVYGTIEAFAADHLRQIFEMKDVRPDRNFQCIIIDEVDSLLLDQGVQLTYLSSPMVSMQHLNTILAMIWGHTGHYGFLSSGYQTFVQGPPASFFKAIFDSINTEETEINDPMDILRIAEETNTVPPGFAEDICNSTMDEIPKKLKIVSQDAMVDFFQEMENYVPYGFTVYTLNDKGLLCLRKLSPYNKHNIPELKFLVLEEGWCCALYDSEEILIKPVAELILNKIQYTPCTDNDKDKISFPGFLKNLIEKKMSVWVENAFLAKQLRKGRDYVVENNSICPVDFRSTGIVELNKKWGDGLQQFVEIKHQIKLSTISTVTNYVSNIAFFQKYQGKIYGTTGTLGSDRDIAFLQNIYSNLSACRMPTFNRKKLFEVKGTLTKSSEEWKSEIKQVVMAQISPNSYRDGRAALVICETINKAKELYQELTRTKELYEELKSSIPGEIILYCRSDKDSLSKIEKKLLPGDVIVATNLAGRGTDIKVSDQVNHNGGLFVILSFLSENTRVELQAFGRTARKGKPGSAQIIMSTEHLQQDFRTVTSLEEAKSTRDRLAAEKINYMMNDVTEMNLREDLFSEYCKTLQDIYKHADGDDRRAVVAIMNEFWGIWLQTKSEDIDQLKRKELQQSLKNDLSMAKSQSQSQMSPNSSIYHYIKFGNIAMEEKKWEDAARLFEKAMNQDKSWAAIAFYSHAYCTIKQRKADYLTNAKEELKKAQESLKYLSEECMVCLQFVKMATVDSGNTAPTSLEKQFTAKCNSYRFFDENITEAIKKLDEIIGREKNALAKKSPVFSLVSNTDEDLQAEAYDLYNRGLKYVFAVEEEPSFWEALLVFFLGILQIIAGALLVVFTAGTLAQVGMGLITEGISDCIYGIEALVTGDFSWKSWAIEKAISIGVSLISCGIGKLIAKGFKACKMALKGLGKKLKALPKFFSRQTKNSLSVVTKTNMKNAVKSAAKKIVEEVIIQGLGKAEEEILKQILNGIKNEVTKEILANVKSNLEKDPLATSVDSIILSYLENKEQLRDLLEDKHRRAKLLDIFKQLSKSAAQPFHTELSWQNKLNSSLISVIDSATAEAKGKVRAILIAIQTTHHVALAVDAIAAVATLSGRFFSNLQEQLNSLKKDKDFSEKVKPDDLSSSDTEMLKVFKQDLAKAISEILADASVEVFHQKFSSHIVSRVQGEVNGAIREQVRSGLKSDRTEEKLRAGQNNTYIVHMPVNPNSKLAVNAAKHSRSHAEKIKNPKTAGTILDIRVLSETTGTKVVILTENKHGKLTKMQEVNPSTKSANQTVTLIYRPKSTKHPNAYYDVRINDQIVSLEHKGRSCLFHALARGMKPKASDNDIALEADRLRSLESEILLKHPGQWESFIKRKEWTDTIRGGDWYMAVGDGLQNIKASKMTLKTDGGQMDQSKKWQKHAPQNPVIRQIINTDKQPPISFILEARKLNQKSKLAQAMLEVGKNSSAVDTSVTASHELQTASVPLEPHNEFPSKDFRTLMATTISKDDVVGMFKLTTLGAMVKCHQISSKTFKTSQNNQKSSTRFTIFDKSFQEHSMKMVQDWFNLLQGKSVMTNTDLTTITEWINNQGYRDQHDALTVSSFME